MAAVDLSLSGLSSGFDWKSMITKLDDANRMPQQKVKTEQSSLTRQNNALGQINTKLSDLQAKADVLKDPTLYTARAAATSDSTIAEVTAADGGVTGTYNIQITQLATPAAWNGASPVTGSLYSSVIDSTSADEGPTLSVAPFPMSVSGGTFTINGHQITIAATDTLQAVFQKISTNTGGIAASYDPGTDHIKLTDPSGSEIVVGATGDTSNFLQAARLYSNPGGGGVVESETKLGSLHLSGSLSSQTLANPLVPDPTTGKGSFLLNGVTISYSPADSISSVLSQINLSGAGVQATYDFANNRLALRNSVPGDRSISMSDVSGNFLSAFQLSNGSLTRGKDLKYTLNGGASILTGNSNTLSPDVTGLSGVTINAIKTGAVTVSVTTDTGKVKSAINDLVTSANAVYTLLDMATASTPDANGKITPGLMQFDPLVGKLSATLRGQILKITGSSGTPVRSLDDLGFSATGYSDTVSATDSTKLDKALANNLSAVQSFFTDASSGLAVGLSNFVKPYVDDLTGSIPAAQKSNNTQAERLSAQLVNMEKMVQSTHDQLTKEFQAYEESSAKTNQQLQFLNSKIGL